MRTVTPFNAPGLFEPPTYTQGIRVEQAQTLLFVSGQLPRFDGRDRSDRGVVSRG